MYSFFLVFIIIFFLSFLRPYPLFATLCARWISTQSYFPVSFPFIFLFVLAIIDLSSPSYMTQHTWLLIPSLPSLSLSPRLLLPFFPSHFLSPPLLLSPTLTSSYLPIAYFFLYFSLTSSLFPPHFLFPSLTSSYLLLAYFSLHFLSPHFISHHFPFISFPPPTSSPHFLPFSHLTGACYILYRDLRLPGALISCYG